MQHAFIDDVLDARQDVRVPAVEMRPAGWRQAVGEHERPEAHAFAFPCVDAFMVQHGGLEEIDGVLHPLLVAAGFVTTEKVFDAPAFGSLLLFGRGVAGVAASPVAPPFAVVNRAFEVLLDSLPVEDRRSAGHLVAGQQAIVSDAPVPRMRLLGSVAGGAVGVLLVVGQSAAPGVPRVGLSDFKVVVLCDVHPMPGHGLGGLKELPLAGPQEL